MKKYLFAGMLSLMSVKGIGADSQQALQQLKEGNQKFIQVHPGEAFTKTVQSQHPFAAILCCADSRVPPELIFQKGIGELFVVRVAGNVAAPAAKDSLVFAADALKVPLIVVLGHQNCGAVDAVLNQTLGALDLSNLVPYIQVGVIKAENMKGVPLVNAIKENVLAQVQYLKLNPILRKYIQAGKLKIVGAYYHLESGQVEFLEKDAS